MTQLQETRKILEIALKSNGLGLVDVIEILAVRIQRLSLDNKCWCCHRIAEYQGFRQEFAYGDRGPVDLGKKLNYACEQHQESLENSAFIPVE